MVRFLPNVLISFLFSFFPSVTDLEISVMPLLRTPTLQAWNLLHPFTTETVLLPIHSTNPDYAPTEEEKIITPKQPLYALMQKFCPATFNHEIRGKEGKQWPL